MFSHGNELITFALGHYSAHIATQFFNVQEASFSYNPNFQTGINHTALFRESSNHSRSSYTPRVIIADDELALGHLSKDGYYQFDENWVGKNSAEAEVIIKENPWKRNEYLDDLIKEKQRNGTEQLSNCDFIMKNSYDLDGGIVSWSDYLVTELCQKSIVTLPKNTDYYENYEQFSNYQSGVELWTKTILKEDIEESTRFFMEEIDDFQGFQVVCDGDNGYSGIASSCLEFLNDEYSKKTILALPVLNSDLTESVDAMTRYRRKCEKTYSFSSSLSTLSQYCDIMTPMSHLIKPWSKNYKIRSFNNIKYKHTSMYHTSGILGAAFDLLTLPFRLQTNSASLTGMANAINIYNRKIAAVGIKIPLPVKPEEDSFSAMNDFTGTFFDSVSPLIEINPDHVDVQSISTKGFGKSQMNDNPEKVYEFIKIFLHKNFPRTLSTVSCCKSNFRVPRTFPNLFDKQFNLSSMDNCYGPLAEHIALGGVHNSKEIGNALSSLYDEVKSVKIKRIPGFAPRDAEIDYSELFEELKNLGLNYIDISYI